VRDLAKSHAQVFIYSIFISSVTVRVVIRVWVRVLGLGLIIPARRANLVLQVIWQCDIFGMTPALIRSMLDQIMWSRIGNKIGSNSILHGTKKQQLVAIICDLVIPLNWCPSTACKLS